MSVLDKIASRRGLRSDVPNQELARELAMAKDQQGIGEIAANLWNRDSAVQGDCIKVLYEIGAIDSSLIADFCGEFLRLLTNRQNRLVWGSMIALATIADQKAEELFPHIDEILRVMENGSVITVDNGIKVLALVAAQRLEYSRKIFPALLNHLATCRAKEIPQHAESTLPAVGAANQAEFIQVLEGRMRELQSSQAARLRKVLRAAEKRRD